MPIEEIIARTETPLTAESLTAKLRECGVEEGQTVLVHLAMSKLGWVVGGAEAVLQGLLAAVGDSGTLMMVTNSSDNTDPAQWQRPPVPESWWQLSRDHMPAYNPLTSPTSGLGVVPELFRTYPGTIRSGHPAYSLAAHGPNAAMLTEEHDLSYDTGERSPVGKLYALDGYVLLLGVGHFNNTSLHLAEVRATYPGKKMIPGGSAMLVDGVRQWVTYDSLDVDNGDFMALGDAFDAAHQIPIRKIHEAEVRFFRQRLAVDFGVAWIEAKRK